MSESTENDRALAKYADGLVEELRENVQKALRDFDADAIHESRVATRRLSAALDLLGPVLSVGPRKKFARVLRKLRGRLGPLRDLDVMIEHLRELSETAPADPGEIDPSEPAPLESPAPVASPNPHAQAIAWVAARLEKERAERRKKAARKRSAPRVIESLAAWWNLHYELIEADEAAATLLADSIHLQLDAFAERAADPKGQKNDKGEEAVKEAKIRHDPHALRKSGKSIRYTLELADKVARPLPDGTIRAFKKMQDALGLWHDYAVLAATAMQASMDEMLAYHDAVLALQVLDLARYAVRRSARALVRFDRLWKRRGEALMAGIREAFPLTRDLTAKAAENVPPPTEVAASQPSDVPEPIAASDASAPVGMQTNEEIKSADERGLLDA